MSQYQWQDIDHVWRGYRGDFGPAYQADAEDVLWEQGLLDESPGEPEESVDEAWVREATTQLQQLEQANGRPFTKAERDAMTDWHGESDEQPNMQKAYEEAVGRPSGEAFYHDKDARQAAATEAMMEAAAASPESED